MKAALPRPLIEADEALHALHRRVHFSRYLNPINAIEARKAFDAGAPAPPFRYHEVDWADEELRVLDRLQPPEDHPMGVLLLRSIHRTRLLIRAVERRTAQAFDELAREACWYPDTEQLSLAAAQRPASDRSRFVLGSSELIEALREALDARGMRDWTLKPDPVMSARVLVDGPKKLLRINSRARFRERDLRKLVAHEVEVHALRSANGSRQPLKLFATGTPDSLVTEEGLALYAEHLAGVQSPGTGWRQGLVVQAVHWARTMGFRELYDRITEAGGRALAWGIAQRIKRGLADPAAPGVYAKDVVYFLGFHKVRDWLAAGGSIEHLYVGKVGVDDPVQQWMDEGWLSPQPVPALFRRLTGPGSARPWRGTPP